MLRCMLRWGPTATFFLLLCPSVLADENATSGGAVIKMPDRGAEFLLEEMAAKGFNIEECVATGCTREQLLNAVCDDGCNNLECENDLGLCHRFFDFHGYGWDFDSCDATGCKRELLYNDQCDEDCDSEVCHFDNWRCFSQDKHKLYDDQGIPWDEDLPKCYASGIIGLTYLLSFVMYMT
eukprot:COSAG05_NODE_1690_length_4271_cov_1.395254_1_plen_180_part_00